MSVAIDTMRALFAVIQPQTGGRSSGNVTSTATGADVELPRGRHLIPIIADRLRPDLTFKTTANPGGGDWTVSSGGTSVGVESVLGGKRHDLPAGTKLRWDPAVSGLDDLVTVDAPGLAGGTDPDFFGGLKSVVVAEDFTGARDVEAFRSQLGGVPAALLQWDGREPATGTTQPGLERGGSRARRGELLYKERLRFWVLSNRKDAAHVRRREGLQILDDLTGLLVDRTAVDGCTFSAPDGVQILECQRVTAGDRALYREFNVYEIAFAVTRSLKKQDLRTYSDLLKIRLKTTVDDELTHDPDEPITVVDTTSDLS